MIRLNIIAVAFIVVVLHIAALTVVSAQPIEPLAMSNASLGGGPLNQYTLGVTDGSGLHNVGLLVKTWGVVTHVDAGQQFFYIDDGSARDDKSGFSGVRVSYTGLAPGNTFDPPLQDQYVVITGISSMSAIDTVEGTRIIPTLRPRDSADLQTP